MGWNYAQCANRRGCLEGARPRNSYNIQEGHIMVISQELLEILVCPKCKGDIYLNDAKDGLICNNCKLKYEIRDDIPVMLIEEAKPIEG